MARVLVSEGRNGLARLLLGRMVDTVPLDGRLSERERFVHARLKATLEKRLS